MASHIDTSHLDALNLRLSNERMRYSLDQSPIRKVWIEQLEKEIAGEIDFLHGSVEDMSDISDDDLLNELLG